jgi:hypothetical protein
VKSLEDFSVFVCEELDAVTKIKPIKKETELVGEAQLPWANAPGPSD